VFGGRDNAQMIASALPFDEIVVKNPGSCSAFDNLSKPTPSNREEVPHLLLVLGAGVTLPKEA